MQTVITLSLNGRAYKLEEPGYLRLRAYLEDAGRRLERDPDRAEILADLEQALGEKCAATLHAHKDVISSAEVERIVTDMGPVEATGPAVATVAVPAFRKLYRLRDKAMLGGVCTGFEGYFGIDVTVIRVLFALFAIVTSGFGALVYLVLWIVVPVADTLEQQAAARGQPFSAQQLIDRAKGKYEEFRGRRPAG